MKVLDAWAFKWGSLSPTPLVKLWFAGWHSPYYTGVLSPHLVPCKVLNSLPCANSCVRPCLYAITNANTKKHASL